MTLCPLSTVTSRSAFSLKAVVCNLTLFLLYLETPVIHRRVDDFIRRA